MTILGDGVAGGVAAQSFDDLDALADGAREVGGAVDEVALVEVVGAHAALRSFWTSAFMISSVVVDAAQEDALVAERNAVHRRGVRGPRLHLDGQFARVVGVDADQERMVLLQHGAELRA